MDTRSEALAGLPYNIRRIETRSRSWNDMRLDVTGAWYEEGEILHPLGNEDSTRLIMMVEERGGFAEARESKRVPCPTDHRLPNSMAFGPAEMPLWGCARTNTYCRDASFIFDIGHLSEKLQHHVSQEQLSSPRLRFNDQRLWTLGKMLVDIPEDDASARLYGESLTAAIFAILFQSNETVASPGSLAPWQLRRVVEYLKTKLPEQVELQELSSLVGLSQWHFARAFKASTGLSPYQYQLDSRLQMAKQHLASTDLSLEAVAEATGFGDAMHLIRVFKKKVGATPAAWRREYRSSGQL